VQIAGQAPSGHTARQVGICAQQPALYRDLRPAENLDFFARLHGLRGPGRRQRVAELMRSFALEPHADRTVVQLSGGWQQRLHIACALVHAPPLLILDEPTAAVDVEARHALWALIEGLQRDGTTILLTTHQLDEAERLCSRVGILQHGRIAAEGAPAELRARVPARAIAMVRTHDEAAARARAAALGWATRSYAGQLGCLLPHAATLREVVEAFDGVDVHSVSVEAVTLEHAYLEVLRRAAPEAAPAGSPAPPAA
jgi:ABC-2 type transport system ATP-binding protein